MNSRTVVYLSGHTSWSYSTTFMFTESISWYVQMWSHPSVSHIDSIIVHLVNVDTIQRNAMCQRWFHDSHTADINEKQNWCILEWSHQPVIQYYIHMFTASSSWHVQMWSHPSASHSDSIIVHLVNGHTMQRNAMFQRWFHDSLHIKSLSLYGCDTDTKNQGASAVGDCCLKMSLA